MQNLLNDLLLLAKLEATDYPATTSRWRWTLSSPASVTTPQACPPGATTISLDAAPAVQLKGSEAELRSAFSNLVFNAVKYTPTKARSASAGGPTNRARTYRCRTPVSASTPAPAAPDRALLPGGLQPRLQHRRHRPRPGHRQARADPPPRAPGNQQRARQEQHLHLPFRPGAGRRGRAQGAEVNLVAVPRRRRRRLASDDTAPHS